MPSRNSEWVKLKGDPAQGGGAGPGADERNGLSRIKIAVVRIAQGGKSVTPALEKGKPRGIGLRLLQCFLGVLSESQSFPLLGNEGIHGGNRCLRRENLFGENPVNFRIGVEKQASSLITTHR